MGEMPLEVVLLIDKIGTGAVLGLILWALWGRYVKTTDALTLTLTGKLDSVVAKLTDVETATKLGLAGVANRVDEHHRRISEAERRLDRHSDLLRALPDPGRSGIYPAPRPRVVGEEVDRQ